MELEEMLKGVLSDEENVKKIQALAAQFSAPERKEPEDSGGTDFLEVQKIMSVISRFKNQKEDNRTRLLLALKPLLGEEKAKRIDGAVKLLKIIDLLPLLRESDLFSSLF